MNGATWHKIKKDKTLFLREIAKKWIRNLKDNAFDGKKRCKQKDLAKIDWLKNTALLLLHMPLNFTRQYHLYQALPVFYANYRLSLSWDYRLCPISCHSTSTFKTPLTLPWMLVENIPCPLPPLANSLDGKEFCPSSPSRRLRKASNMAVAFLVFLLNSWSWLASSFRSWLAVLMHHRKRCSSTDFYFPVVQTLCEKAR